MFEKIKFWYKRGLWTKKMVENAKEKGVITNEQMKEILKQKEK